MKAMSWGFHRPNKSTSIPIFFMFIMLPAKKVTPVRGLVRHIENQDNEGLNGNWSSVPPPAILPPAGHEVKVEHPARPVQGY